MRQRAGASRTVRVLAQGMTRHPLLSTPEQAAVFASAVTVPASFERSLMPRGWLDQGLVSGVSLLARYGVTILAQDAVTSAVSRLAARAGLGGTGQRVSTGAANLAALGLGLAARRAIPRRSGERIARAAVRTAAEEVARGGVAGVAAAATVQLTEAVNARGGRLRLRPDPMVALTGALASALVELRRRRRYAEAVQQAGEQVHVSVARSLAAGTGVAASLTLVSTGERLLADGVGRALRPLSPGTPTIRRLTGHATSLGALAGGVFAVMHDLYRDIEAGAGKPEPGLDQPPRSPFVSGGRGSLVGFSTLSREGRRHVLSAVRPEWIADVMGRPAVAEPAYVYIGLDSAPSIEERVRLALAELDRTGAFDRSLLVLVTPTGTGYVNYGAIETAAYLTLGDLATVTLQYSKRPSPLSLDRVALGREQNRALWLAIHERLYERPPERRPRVVLFGESLGAHTSQDVFLHWGTAGMEALGIDRALWLGTPYASGWKDEVLGRRRPDVDRSVVGVFSAFEEYAALPEDEREQVRYIMLTHGDDPIAYFGLDLLVHEPDWLEAPRPPGVPASMRWRPLHTFLQTLADMKNAMNVVPGQFVADGHDYRADIAEFVRAAFGLSATPEEMARVEAALRRFEKRFFDTIDEARAAAEKARSEEAEQLPAR